MTRIQIDQLLNENIDQSWFRKTYPDYRLSHGVAVGLDYGPIKDQHNPIAAMASEIDITTYHATIIDESVVLDKTIPFKDILTEKDTRNLIVRFSSTNTEEVEDFIQKWLDPNFKFN